MPARDRARLERVCRYLLRPLLAQERVRRQGPHGIATPSEEALELMELSALADRAAGSLTVGNVRRLEVARAVATRPDLLLADEPCAGLNPTETGAMVACLRRVRDRGTTVWLVEHAGGRLAVPFGTDAYGRFGGVTGSPGGV